LGQLFGGLGWVWVDEMDSRTTLACPLLHALW